jgi:hypothetical protein
VIVVIFVHFVVGKGNHSVQILILCPAIEPSGNDTDSFIQRIRAEGAQRIYRHAAKIVPIIHLVQISIRTGLPNPETPLVVSAIISVIMDLNGRLCRRRDIRACSMGYNRGANG